LFEIVQVDEQQGRYGAVDARALECVLGELQKGVAAGQTRQAVFVDQARRLRFVRLAFADVLQGNGQVLAHAHQAPVAPADVHARLRRFVRDAPVFFVKARVHGNGVRREQRRIFGAPVHVRQQAADQAAALVAVKPGALLVAVDDAKVDDGALAVAHGRGHVKTILGMLGGSAVDPPHLVLFACARRGAQGQHAAQRRQDGQRHGGAQRIVAAVAPMGRRGRQRFVEAQCHQRRDGVVVRWLPAQHAGTAVGGAWQQADAGGARPHRVLGRQQRAGLAGAGIAAAVLFDAHRPIRGDGAQHAGAAQHGRVAERSEIGGIDGHQHDAIEFVVDVVEPAGQQHDATLAPGQRGVRRWGGADAQGAGIAVAVVREEAGSGKVTGPVPRTG
jgi:hypothetical protein